MPRKSRRGKGRHGCGLLQESAPREGESLSDTNGRRPGWYHMLSKEDYKARPYAWKPGAGLQPRNIPQVAANFAAKDSNDWIFKALHALCFGMYDVAEQRVSSAVQAHLGMFSGLVFSSEAAMNERRKCLDNWPTSEIIEALDLFDVPYEPSEEHQVLAGCLFRWLLNPQPRTPAAVLEDLEDGSGAGEKASDMVISVKSVIPDTAGNARAADVMNETRKAASEAKAKPQKQSNMLIANSDDNNKVIPHEPEPNANDESPARKGVIHVIANIPMHRTMLSLMIASLLTYGEGARQQGLRRDFCSKLQEICRKYFEEEFPINGITTRREIMVLHCFKHKRKPDVNVSPSAPYMFAENKYRKRDCFTWAVGTIGPCRDMENRKDEYDIHRYWMVDIHSFYVFAVSPLYDRPVLILTDEQTLLGFELDPVTRQALCRRDDNTTQCVSEASGLEQFSQVVAICRQMSTGYQEWQGSVHMQRRR